MKPCNNPDCELHDDPYGFVIHWIRQALSAGLAHEGQMNDREFANLIAIEEFIRTRDNA